MQLSRLQRIVTAEFPTYSRKAIPDTPNWMIRCKKIGEIWKKKILEILSGFLGIFSELCMCGKNFHIEIPVYQKPKFVSPSHVHNKKKNEQSKYQHCENKHLHSINLSPHSYAIWSRRSSSGARPFPVHIQYNNSSLIVDGGNIKHATMGASYVDTFSNIDSTRIDDYALSVPAICCHRPRQPASISSRKHPHTNEHSCAMYTHTCDAEIHVVYAQINGPFQYL